MNILNKYFDKIYLIAMEGSPRIERMRERLNGAEYEIFYGINGGLIDKTPYIEMGSKQTRGQLGCTLSHLEIYKKIVSEGTKKTLIIEDDCVFYDDVNQLGDYMKELPEDWGLFYLGWDGTDLPNNYSSKICEISKDFFRFIHCTHSIALSNEFAKEILEINKNVHYTADGVLSQLIIQKGLKKYAAVPKLTTQDGIDSITVEVDKQYGF